MIGDMDEHQNWFTPFAGVLGVVVGFILATLKQSALLRPDPPETAING